jgi:hypothetical protein
MMSLKIWKRNIKPNDKKYDFNKFSSKFIIDDLSVWNYHMNSAYHERDTQNGEFRGVFIIWWWIHVTYAGGLMNIHHTRLILNFLFI